MSYKAQPSLEISFFSAENLTKNRLALKNAGTHGLLHQFSDYGCLFYRHRMLKIPVPNVQLNYRCKLD